MLDNMLWTANSAAETLSALFNLRLSACCPVCFNRTIAVCALLFSVPSLCRYVALSAKRSGHLAAKVYLEH